MRSTLCFLLLLLPATAFSQDADSLRITPDDYRVYRADGTPASFDDVAAALAEADVVFVGEEHNDPVAHHLQARLLEAAFQEYGAVRPVALSLEMFQRDVQGILDEYLAGLITEKHFKADSRPWQNYQADYRPLVEYARTHRLPVVAANAPRRYVNRVTRLGPTALADLSDRARTFLPPLPYAPASEAYRAKWDRLMAESMAEMPSRHDTSRVAPSAPADTTAMMHGGALHLLASQSLWDAAMAFSIAEHLLRTPGALVLHMVGGFHVERHTGIPEHLLRYRPGTRILVVAVRPAASLAPFDVGRFEGLGDFVILTDETLPRTFETSP